jgi:hypothetical protein
MNAPCDCGHGRAGAHYLQTYASGTDLHCEDCDRPSCATCPHRWADECHMYRERFVAGQSNTIPACAVHDAPVHKRTRNAPGYILDGAE